MTFFWLLLRVAWAAVILCFQCWRKWVWRRICCFLPCEIYQCVTQVEVTVWILVIRLRINRQIFFHIFLIFLDKRYIRKSFLPEIWSLFLENMETAIAQKPTFAYSHNIILKEHNRMLMSPKPTWNRRQIFE